jgi:Bifunctional DNA primase/polymerase, N-terminal
MNQPLESQNLEASVLALGPTQDTSQADGAAARKSAKADWNAAPPFPVASRSPLLSEAIAAAACAGSVLDAALAVAGHGVPVFPVSPIGQKRPLNGHGIYSATTDQTIVRRDFSRHPNALIAVPMGRRTGVFAIDVDASPPHADDGVAAWRALEGKHSALLTRTHRTASGGLHLLFRWPPERPVGCRVKGLPKGIEVKGEGGSIVFPPSERGGSKYTVVTDIEPAHAPNWLLDIVAPVLRMRTATTPSRQRSVHRDGSPYGLKALDNACAKLAYAGPGERDRAVGENVLAIGSLVAGGELDERHALQALKQAGQSNSGANADYCDKIERAFETGKENPRSAPPRRSPPKRAAKQRSNAADTSKRDIGTDIGDRSCPSCPSYPRVPDQQTGEKKSSSAFDELVARTEGVDPSDEARVSAILAEGVECGLPDFQIERLIRLLAKKVGVGIKPLRRLLNELRSTAATAAQPKGEERVSDEREDEEDRKRDADDRREALQRGCSRIASSPKLLAEMEAVVHELGVVGEGASIRGAYLAFASRLLRKRAICLLRRGAAAGGKNFLLSAVLRLIPSESVVVLSSGSPMSLVYYGGEDEDALKHKVLYVQEAAILAERAGIESPLTVLLRLLISEGQIDHLIAIPQGGETPITLKIKRNGPVAVCITSARDNIESEMLTRLMTSDADESPEQTMAIVRGLLSNNDSENEPDLTLWLDFQRLLELDAPYEVTVPFGASLYRAYEKRLQAFPNALQLRMRRDVSGLISAIKTSAVLHKAQRDRGAKDRIIATIDDYRHAHRAFDEGVSSLYGVKTRKEIIAVVKAVEEMGGKIGESLKVTVAALRQKLGINSNKTASDRLMEAVERCVLELDEEKSGSGRGAPRYFKLLKSSSQIASEPGQGVFPPPDDVLREINFPPSVSPGHGDMGDMMDKTEPSGQRSPTPEKKTAGWSVRL